MSDVFFHGNPSFITELRTTSIDTASVDHHPPLLKNIIYGNKTVSKIYLQVILGLNSLAFVSVEVRNASVVCSMNGGIGDNPVPGSPGIANGPEIISIKPIKYIEMVTKFLLGKLRRRHVQVCYGL